MNFSIKSLGAILMCLGLSSCNGGGSGSDPVIIFGSASPSQTAQSSADKSTQNVSNQEAQNSSPSPATIYDSFPTVYKIATDGTLGLPAPKTAPMGWNSWNTFACNINENLIIATAKAMVDSGMRDAGYRYVNLDTCWMDGRDPKTHQLLADPVAFPGGIPALASKIHAMNLKFGIYTSSASWSCIAYYRKLRPDAYIGSEGYEDIDAQTFADWGVDYLKYDFCQGNPDRSQFTKMRDALIKTGKNIIFSANFDLPAKPLPKSRTVDFPSIVHVARVTSDITANFTSILKEIDAARVSEALPIPGFWNDPDMLEVGKLASSDEDKAHFAMWAMLAAPLILGNDLRNQSTVTQQILTNKNIIAVDQDPLNIQATLVYQDATGALQVWNKPLFETGTRAVALLNRSTNANTISVKWTDIGVLADTPVQVYDLYAGHDLGMISQASYSTIVPAHGVVVLKVTGQEAAVFPSGTAILSDAPYMYQVAGFGSIRINVPNGESKAQDGTPMKMGGQTFAKGIGAASPSQVLYRLDKKCTKLSVHVGVDDDYNTKTSTFNSANKGSMQFQIWGDGVLLADSGVMSANQPPKMLTADISKTVVLRLIVKSINGKQVDYADWADPEISCK